MPSDKPERTVDQWLPKMMTAAKKRRAAIRHQQLALEFDAQAAELEAEVERIREELAS